MRFEGDFVIYVLEGRWPGTTWFSPNYDNFGHPPGFTASDECWQKTGIFGTFDKVQGFDALRRFSEQHIEYDWSLREIHFSQHTTDVALVYATNPDAPPAIWGRNKGEMQRRFEAVRGTS